MDGLFDDALCLLYLHVLYNFAEVLCSDGVGRRPSLLHTIHSLQQGLIVPRFLLNFLVPGKACVGVSHNGEALIVTIVDDDGSGEWAVNHNGSIHAHNLHAQVDHFLGVKHCLKGVPMEFVIDASNLQPVRPAIERQEGPLHKRIPRENLLLLHENLHDLLHWHEPLLPQSDLGGELLAQLLPQGLRELRATLDLIVGVFDDGNQDVEEDEHQQHLE
mmetsp:Transcript_14676/g.32219  ORF Transcript_14676/g.32219 Transcript_14676/m.32219 type:complete len:217 (+) Transcript_14676:1505-2155(+)